MDDGFSTTLTLANLPDAKMYERELVLSGPSMEGPINSTTMRNLQYRTNEAKALKSLPPFSITVAFATELFHFIKEQVGVNQLITVTFPDATTMYFYGWVEEFTPGKMVEGEQSTATLTIHASLVDSNNLETPPAYGGHTPPSVLLSITSELTAAWVPGADVFIRITVENLSDNDAINAVVTTVLPGSFTLTSTDPTTFATIPANSSVTIDMAALPSAPGSYIVTSSVVADNPDSADSTDLEVDLSAACGFETTPAVKTGSTTSGLLWKLSAQSLGPNVSVHLVNNGSSLPLSVSVVGTAITIQLSTTSGGVVNSSANSVKAAVDAHAQAHSLVTVSLARVSDGTGTVAAAAAFFLSDGGGGNGFECYPDGAIDASIVTGINVTSMVLGDGP